MVSDQRLQKFVEANCDFITFQKPSYDCKHVYYTTAMFFDEKKAGVSRDSFCKALTAEGVPIFQGYVKPLYHQSIYQNRNHYVLKQRTDIDYTPGLCPAAEELHYNRLFFTMVLRPMMSDELFEQVKNAFKKVIDHRSELK